MLTKKKKVFLRKSKNSIHMLKKSAYKPLIYNMQQIMQ